MLAEIIRDWVELRNSQPLWVGQLGRARFRLIKYYKICLFLVFFIYIKKTRLKNTQEFSHSYLCLSFSLTYSFTLSLHFSLYLSEFSRYRNCLESGNLLKQSGISKQLPIKIHLGNHNFSKSLHRDIFYQSTMYISNFKISNF